MLVAAGVALKLGVAAERRSLESIAEPLSCRGPDWRLPNTRNIL